MTSTQEEIIMQFTNYLSEKVSEATERYMSELSEGSRKNFKYLLNHFLKYLEKSPEKILEDDIKGYFIYLSSVKQNRNDTLHTKLTYLLSYFRYLDETEIKHESGSSFEALFANMRIQPRENRVKDRNFISTETIRTLFSYLEDKELWDLRLAAELAVRYGLSTSKILALSKTDLLQTDDFYYCHISDKRKALQRNIGLRTETVELFLKVCSQDSPIIFRSKRGGDRLSARRLEYLISEAGRNISNNPITLSKLRNTCIAYLLSEGATYDEIEFMTGSPASMLFRYRNFSGRLAETALRYKGIDF